MTKKSKKNLSNSKNVKPPPKKLNPFEMHINRKKYDILGMKSKSEKGLPGISRAKSLKKRKRTLLQEYKFKDKNNMFVDRRIGEKNRAMTAEDKILARYAAERIKLHSKKSIFNLGDDEELTHKGQTLTEIEKFDDPRSDDDDDEEGGGKLDSNFVEEAHFGGGIFRKVEGESKSRKDIIDQLIAESIKRKQEKQKLKQQTLDLTEKLDTEWKELLPLVTASKKTKSDVEDVNPKDDKFASYDIMSKKLKFEARGKPSDRLKSEEEIAREEKEKLEQLEKERLERMRGEIDKKTIKHRSADDLDDGFDLDQDSEPFLSYKDGELNIEGDLSNDLNKNGKESDEEGEEEDDDESGEDEEDAEEEDEDNDNKNEEMDVDKNEESENDNLSDLKDSDDEEDLNQKHPEKLTANNTTNHNEEEIQKEADEKAKIMEAARNELPYTFKIPKEYDEFENLLKNYNPEFQSVVIERMIKCHHPSLNEEFKNDLDLLYTFMLQHLQDCATDPTTKVSCFKILDRLAASFYDLTQWNPQNSSNSLIEVIKEKYSDYVKSHKLYPSLDTLIFLKLVSILFPTSDYRHPVVTPSLIFIQQMLFNCRVQSSVDLSKGLFLVTLVFEYCALSKKFVPEAINFLLGVLKLTQPKNHPLLPPFELAMKNSFDLSITDKTRKFEPTKLCINDLIYKNSTEEFKVNCINLALNLLSRFVDFWDETQPAVVLFEPFINLLNVNNYVECLQNNARGVLDKIMKFKQKGLKKLMMQKKKPMPLKQYEPRIEKVYSLKKYKPMGKEKTERAKMMHKYKREMKGALREIRRDRSFIAKLKHKEIVKSDLERQRKVREILGSAAQQAGELNKLKRQKL